MRLDISCWNSTHQLLHTVRAHEDVRVEIRSRLQGDPVVLQAARQGHVSTGMWDKVVGPKVLEGVLKQRTLPRWSKHRTAPGTHEGNEGCSNNDQKSLVQQLGPGPTHRAPA